MKAFEDAFEEGIGVSPEEAMLLDWVLTMHSFDESFMDWLMKPEIREWREQAGMVIVGQKKCVNFTPDDLRLLLTLIPITFRFGQNDVGFSLKNKLYKAYLGVGSGDESKTKDETDDSPYPSV